MRKKVIWIAAVLVLIAIPAVIGLVALRGDDGTSRRSAALIQAGQGGGYQLAFTAGTPAIHKGGEAVDVDSYSWGGTAKGGTVAGTTRTAPPEFGELQITKRVDTASPLLATALVSGKPYEATLTLYKTSADMQQDYMIYKLKNVLITSIQHGGSADEVPTEQISLNYGEIEVTVKDVAGKGGVSGQTMFKYNVGAAKAG